MLNQEDSLLLVVDVQERLVNMLYKSTVVGKTSKLVRAAKLLNVPIIATEQYPTGLGSTVEDVKQYFYHDTPVVTKTAFSALREPGFMNVLKSFGKKQVVVCGIETHVCVHQTVADLISEDFEVYVAKDACASREKYEFEQGIDCMCANGAKISCVEIILFEWLKDAKNPSFKEVQALIK